MIAYRQPVTRFQVAAVRGVNVDGVFRTLASRGLIHEVGTDPGPGQATLYGTTPAFLEQLGLNDLDQLPRSRTTSPRASTCSTSRTSHDPRPPAPPPSGGTVLAPLPGSRSSAGVAVPPGRSFAHRPGGPSPSFRRGRRSRPSAGGRSRSLRPGGRSPPFRRGTGPSAAGRAGSGDPGATTGDDGSRPPLGHVLTPSSPPSRWPAARRRTPPAHPRAAPGRRPRGGRPGAQPRRARRNAPGRSRGRRRIGGGSGKADSRAGTRPSKGAPSAATGVAPRGDGGEPVRLNKALSGAGLGSRRAVEELVRAGRVSIGGAVVHDLGRRVDPVSDRVEVDGSRVVLDERRRYWLLNKPAGVVSTAADPAGRPTVVGMVPEQPRVFPVGRLDRDTEGLLLLTNDGPLAYRLTHARYGIEKRYLAEVERLPADAPGRLRKGSRARGRLRQAGPGQGGRRLRSSPHGRGRPGRGAQPGGAAAAGRRRAPRCAGSSAPRSGRSA